MCALPVVDEDAGAVLDAAVPLYWMFGRMDVSLPVLAQEAAVPEAALERLFGDARGAFLAALDRYVETCAAHPFRAWATEGPAAFAAATLDLVYDGDTGRGCLLMLAVAQLAAADGAVAAAVAAHVGGLLALAARRPALAPKTLVLAFADAATRARAGRSRGETAAALEAALVPPETAGQDATAALAAGAAEPASAFDARLASV